MNARLETLLGHAYSYAGYSSVAARQANQAAETAPKPDTPPQASSVFGSYPAVFSQQIPSAPAPLQPPPLIAPPLASVPAAAIPHTADDDEPLTFVRQSKLSHSRKMTFKNLWWSIDAVLCLAIIVYFWATDARTITDYLLAPFLYITFLQIFFVPMWFVIRIARRLMANGG